MTETEKAALSEIYCFDPSWKDGTLPLSRDCVKQFFYAGVAYERERAKREKSVKIKTIEQAIKNQNGKVIR